MPATEALNLRGLGSVHEQFVGEPESRPLASPEAASQPATPLREVRNGDGADGGDGAASPMLPSILVSGEPGVAAEKTISPRAPPVGRQPQRTRAIRNRWKEVQNCAEGTSMGSWTGLTACVWPVLHRRQGARASGPQAQKQALPLPVPSASASPALRAVQ
jgi:hypothetical protein